MLDGTMTLLPNGIVREAAIVIPCMGFCPLAVIPVPFVHTSLHAQYAVIVAVMMLVIMV